MNRESLFKQDLVHCLAQIEQTIEQGAVQVEDDGVKISFIWEVSGHEACHFVISDQDA